MSFGARAIASRVAREIDSASDAPSALPTTTSWFGACTETNARRGAAAIADMGGSADSPRAIERQKKRSALNSSIAVSGAGTTPRVGSWVGGDSLGDVLHDDDSAATATPRRTHDDEARPRTRAHPCTERAGGSMADRLRPSPTATDRDRAGAHQ